VFGPVIHSLAYSHFSTIVIKTIEGLFYKTSLDHLPIRVTILGIVMNHIAPLTAYAHPVKLFALEKSPNKLTYRTWAQHNPNDINPGNQPKTQPQFGGRLLNTLSLFVAILLFSFAIYNACNKQQEAREREAFNKTLNEWRNNQPEKDEISDAAALSEGGSTYSDTLIEHFTEPPIPEKDIQSVKKILEHFSKNETDPNRFWSPLPDGFSLGDEQNLADKIYPPFIQQDFPNSDIPLSFTFSLTPSQDIEKFKITISNVVRACYFVYYEKTNKSDIKPSDLKKEINISILPLKNNFVKVSITH